MDAWVDRCYRRGVMMGIGLGELAVVAFIGLVLIGVPVVIVVVILFRKKS